MEGSGNLLEPWEVVAVIIVGLGGRDVVIVVAAGL